MAFATCISLTPKSISHCTGFMVLFNAQTQELATGSERTYSLEIFELFFEPRAGVGTPKTENWTSKSQPPFPLPGRDMLQIFWAALPMLKKVIKVVAPAALLLFKVVVLRVTARAPRPWHDGASPVSLLRSPRL